jgi:hypothetical protein
MHSAGAKATQARRKKPAQQWFDGHFFYPSA